MPNAFLTATARWNAVRSRDTAADGTFVYAVRTTKIYCRPVCKARLARRDNVSFYAAAHEAESDGFRPCKRCKPSISGQMPEEQAVARVRALIQQELACPQTTDALTPTSNVRSLANLAKKAGISKWHFCRVFKDVTGATPIDFLQQQGRSVAGSETSETVSPRTSPCEPQDASITHLGDDMGDLFTYLDMEMLQDLGQETGISQLIGHSDWSAVDFRDVPTSQPCQAVDPLYFPYDPYSGRHFYGEI